MKNSVFVLLAILVILCSCSSDDPLNSEIAEEQEEIQISEIPSSNVDYSAMRNWAIHPDKNSIFNSLFYQNLNISVIDKNLNLDQVIEIPNNAAVNTGTDVFYLHPTSSVNNENLNSEARAIPIEEQINALGENYTTGLVIAQGGLLAKYGRLYAPRYSESTGATFFDEQLSDLERAEIILTTYADVRSAFLEYLNIHNNGNRIILAGHSQGSFLAGLLLREFFDNDDALRSKLVTASLGGMGGLFAEKGTNIGGWWKNIPLCESVDAINCVHTWRSYGEFFSINDNNFNLHQFNQNLVEMGLVYRAFNPQQDWFVQDNSFYKDSYEPLEYYITPNNSDYSEFGFENRFLAFNGMYQAKFQRDNDLTIGLRIRETIAPDDLRRNELQIVRQTDPNFLFWGYHTKDYHLYNWALLQQIDEKLRRMDN